MGIAPDTDHVLLQVGIAPDDQVAANQDDFDTARAAGNARTHGPPGPVQAAVVASPHLADVGQ